MAKTTVHRREGKRERLRYYVDRSGNEVFGKGFVAATDFCHGVAQVSSKSRWGLRTESIIYTSGKTIFSWKWRR